MKRTPLLRKTPLAPSKTRLRQKRSTTTPTKAERARFDAMALCPCLACHLNALWKFHETGMEREIHHLLSGGRRIGHHASIRLCHYHHQGKRLPGSFTSYRKAAERYGPSLEREPRKFHDAYGSDTELLRLQDAMIARVRTRAAISA